MKWKFAFWIKQIAPLRLFSRYFTFIFHISPAVSKKNTSFLYFCWNKGTLLHTLARKTKISSYKHWREKYNCHICYNDFSNRLDKRLIVSLFLGLERKHKHETYTLLGLCLIKFFPLIFHSYCCISWLPRELNSNFPTSIPDLLIW